MRTSIATSPYGQIRAAPEQAGGTLGNLDTMIAAHALARGSGMLPWSHVRPPDLGEIKMSRV